MSQWSHYHHITAFSEFLAYKTRVPVRGAILLNQSMDEVVLVKGWKKGANWSFPRGKINKDEKDLDCAIREVYEETGFDIKEAGLVQEEKDMKYIEIAMREQHMRLYVFRGIPMDTHFEPRTRKEISKIDWYKLSDLPTIKKNKQQDDHLAVNANKFYMVAPFLNPLKKWITQQRKNEINKAAHPTQPTQILTRNGEAAVGRTAGTVRTSVPAQKHEPVETQTPSDLPEVSVPQDASVHLKRLLNINGLMPASRDAPSEEQKSLDPGTSKSNALLSLLRSGSSGVASNTPAQEPQQQTPVSQPAYMARPPQEYPLQPTPIRAPFGGLSQPSQPPMPQSRFPGMNTAVHLPHGQLPVHQFHTGPGPVPMPRADPQMFNQQHMPHNQPPPVPHFPQQPIQPMGHPGNQRPPQPAPPLMQQSHNISFQQGANSIPQTSGPPSGRQTPAPYQRTGDPEFAQADPDNVPLRSVPPANKLPPPKLTSHSLALLSVFKNETSQQPRDIPTSDPLKQGKESLNRRKSQHQDNLLDLLKQPSIPTTTAVHDATEHPARVELAAQHTPSLRQAAVNQQPPLAKYGGASASPGYRERSQTTRKTQLGSGTTTAATVSGPLNIPQFEEVSKSASRHTSSARQRQTKDKKAPAPPFTILSRPNTGKKEPTTSTEPVARPPPQQQPQRHKQPEPAKPFQPQILRRQDKPDLEKSLPTHTVTVSEFSQRSSKRPTPEPQKEPAHLTYDRRPSQPAAQKEALLSLFGKSASPPVQAASATSNQSSPPSKSPLPSTVISPLDKVAFGADVQAEIAQATISRIGSFSSAPDSRSHTPNKPKATSPTNKAFLLGFLDGVAKGSR